MSSKIHITLFCLMMICASVCVAQNTESLAGKDFSQDFTIKDTLYKQPFIDVDEWRDKPVRHRYVHGGFKGSEARFSFYFPPKEKYQGRFFK